MRLLPTLFAPLLIFAFTAMASAQNAPKVAVVNAGKVFTDMKETADLKKKIDDETKSLQAESDRRSALVEKARQDRDMVKPGTPDYDARTEDYLQKSIDLRAWQDVRKLELTREQKSDMKRLMDEILSAVKTIAEQEHVDLVISEQSADLPDDLESMTVDQVRAVINSRNVLYKDSAVDLTSKVTAALDAAYLGGAGGTPTTNP